MAVPLGVEAGLTEPHAPVLPQLTVHVTPALTESFKTVAVTFAVVLTCTEDAELATFTEIAGGGVVFELLEPPQATEVAIEANVTTRRTVIPKLIFRNFIAHLPLLQSWS